MDFQQQWRSQHQSDQHQPTAKVPKLNHLVDHQQQQQQSPASSALALFAPEPNSSGISKATITTPLLSALPDSTPTRFPRMGGFFSLAQWQELELQALIYKYMLAGAPIPLELILPIKRSILTASPYYHHPQQYQHLQPAMLQGGYWGRCVVDPEPGRCRRTDGKKWRCSREVVAGQKYCERHVHRGRNRSRKHVEIPTPVASSGLKPTLPSPLSTTKEPHFTLSGSSPMLDILPLNQRPPDGKAANGCLPQGYCPKFSPQELQGDKADGRILRRFFDDWPRAQQELTPSNSNASSAASTTHLSISIPGNSSSDFSLKLSTGNGDKPRPGSNKDTGDGRMQPPSANWSGWGSHGEPSMGGPLAEALRSSTSTPSPTSVLQKPHGSVSETSSTST